MKSFEHTYIPKLRKIVIDKNFKKLLISFDYAKGATLE